MEFLLIPVLLVLVVLCFLKWTTRTVKPPATVANQPLRAPGGGAVPADPSGTHPHPVSATREGASGSYLPSEEWEQLLVTDAEGMPTLYLQMHSGELRLTEPTTGKLVSVGNKHLRGMGIWTVNLRGVDCHKTAAREGLLMPGSTVSLIREHDHADGDAIAVHAAAGRPVGYVNKGIATGLAQLLDAGTTFHAISLACDTMTTLHQTGVVKVLAASPELVQHLLRKRPNATLALANLDVAC